MTRRPLRVMENVGNLRHKRGEVGAAQRRIESKITTSPGPCWAVAGVSGNFRSRAEAEAAARQLQAD